MGLLPMKFPDQKKLHVHLLYEVIVSYFHEITAESLILFIFFFFKSKYLYYYVRVTSDVYYTHII